MTCGECGQEHARAGLPTCTGHVIWDRATYVPGQGRQRLPEPRPCMKHPGPGQVKCRMHGAAAPQAKAKAAKAMTEDKARRLAAKWGVPVDTDPTEAILGRICAVAGDVKFYADQVAQLTPEAMVWGKTRRKKGGDDAGTTWEAGVNTWITLYNEASRDLVRFSAEALRNGIEQRRIRLAEQQGTLVADVLRAVAAQLDLSDGQRARFAEVVPIELRRLAS